MKRLANPTTYEVTTDRARYAVTIERRNNDRNGCPQYRANIITLHYFGEEPATGCFYTVAYNFKGHYLNEAGEAAEVVRQHEELITD